jgi:hypothetical protein
MRVYATLCMLKYLIPNIRQEISLSRISTGVEILWKSHPYTCREVILVWPIGFDAAKKRPALATSDDCWPQVAATSDTRAGILPKSNVLSKRKLSGIFEYGPHIIHNFSTVPISVDVASDHYQRSKAVTK